MIRLSCAFARHQQKSLLIVDRRVHARTIHAVRQPAAMTSDNAIEEAKVQIDDVLINYARSGHGRHFVLCLPGSLGEYGLHYGRRRSGSWDTDFADVLRRFDGDQFTLVGWDAPGYGKSRPPDRRCSIDSNRLDADYAHGLMQRLQLTPYSLIGWSDGGATALCIAHKYAREVRKVVTMGATAYITQDMCRIYRGE